VIRRYPCIELECQRALLGLVDLKVSFHGDPLTDLVRALGTEDIEILNTKAILPYQTKRYATERRK
jgi:hypothetical protein